MLNHATLSFLLFILATWFFELTSSALVQQQPLVLKYHNGALLKGTITLNLVWYGKFTHIQRSIIVDFLQSFQNSGHAAPPSVASWWKTTEKYHGGASSIVIAKQILDENYSLGKSLKNYHLSYLASKASQPNSLTVVLTAKDVAVDGFCMNRCGTYGSTKGKNRIPYVWVGNSETQCPGLRCFNVTLKNQGNYTVSARFESSGGTTKYIIGPGESLTVHIPEHLLPTFWIKPTSPKNEETLGSSLSTDVTSAPPKKNYNRVAILVGEKFKEVDGNFECYSYYPDTAVKKCLECSFDDNKTATSCKFVNG